jgi:hypothetical protein
MASIPGFTFLVDKPTKSFLGLFIHDCRGVFSIGGGSTADKPAHQMKLFSVSGAVSAHKQMESHTQPSAGGQLTIH